MSSDLLLLLFLALCIALLIGFVYQAIESAKQKRRLDRLLAIKLGNQAGDAGGPGDAGADRRKIVQSKLKEAEAKRLKRRGYKLREDLILAGWEDVPPWRFNIFRGGLAIFSALVAYALLEVHPLIAFTVVPLVFGIGLPMYLLSTMAKRRLKEFTRLFADALDVIVRGVRAGLPVPECIGVIGREMPDPVGKEFRLISEGTRLGMPLDECLDRAIDRVPTAELRFFSIVLIIQRQTGGNLADTLTKLSDVLRGRKKMRDKIQAMSSEAKASAMIIGALPIVVGLLLSLVAPDYIALLFTTRTGNIAIGIGLVWMGIGIFVMKQMISFEM